MVKPVLIIATKKRFPFRPDAEPCLTVEKDCDHVEEEQWRLPRFFRTCRAANVLLLSRERPPRAGRSACAISRCARRGSAGPSERPLVGSCKELCRPFA